MTVTIADTAATDAGVPAPLGPSALAALARRVAGQRAGWEDRCRFDPGRRHYERLWRDDRVEVWVISWMPGHDTGFHDHDGSAGAFAVAAGELTEDRLALATEAVSRTVGEGGVVGFDADHLHRVRNLSDRPAVSIHAYSPPLTRLGSYSVDDDGVLRRSAQDAGIELTHRP